MLPKLLTSPVKNHTSPTYSDSSRMDARVIPDGPSSRKSYNRETLSHDRLTWVAAMSVDEESGSTVLPNEEDSLPPLERARRRQSVLPQHD